MQQNSKIFDCILYDFNANVCAFICLAKRSISVERKVISFDGLHLKGLLRLLILPREVVEAEAVPAPNAPPAPFAADPAVRADATPPPGPTALLTLEVDLVEVADEVAGALPAREAQEQAEGAAHRGDYGASEKDGCCCRSPHNVTHSRLTLRRPRTSPRS